MSRFENDLLDELMRVATTTTAPAPAALRKRGRRRSLAVAAVTTLAVAGAASASTVGGWFNSSDGDRPRGPIATVRQPVGASQPRVVAYDADDGLCLRVDRPGQTDDSSTACANVDAPPYTGADAAGVVLDQREADRRIVLGLVGSEVSAVLTTPGGTRADLVALSGPAAGARGLRAFVLELKADDDVRSLQIQGPSSDRTLRVINDVH